MKLPQFVRSRAFVRSVACLGLVSLGAGWIYWQAAMAHRQHLAVEAVHTCGGQVRYDWQLAALTPPTKGFGFEMESEPPGPKWLREIIGDEYFQRVLVVMPHRIAIVGENGRTVPHLTLATTTSSGTPAWSLGRGRNKQEIRHMIKEIVSLRTVRELDLTGCPLEASSLKDLNGMRSLRKLSMRKPVIFDTYPLLKPGDIGAHLTALPRIEELDLGALKLNDHDLLQIGQFGTVKKITLDLNGQPCDIGAFANLTDLEYLSLRGVSDATNLAPLSGLSQLEELELFCESQPDLGPLATLTGLKKLDISMYEARDADFQSIARLTGLEELRLDCERGQLRGIDRLSVLGNLHTLNIRTEPISVLSLADVFQLKQLVSLSIDTDILPDAEELRIQVAAKMTHPGWAAPHDLGRGGVLTTHSVGVLTPMPELNYLYLAPRYVTEDAARHIEHLCPNLSELQLHVFSFKAKDYPDSQDYFEESRRRILAPPEKSELEKFRTENPFYPFGEPTT